MDLNPENLNKDEISGQNRVHSKNVRFVNLWKGNQCNSPYQQSGVMIIC